MSSLTYTSTGLLNLATKTINLTTAIPNPPLRSNFELTYYNLSKISILSKDIMNVILCEFTFNGDPGSVLSTPTSDSYSISLAYDTIPNAPGISGVTALDFSVSPVCLFLFFHSTDANADDRQAFFDDMETLYGNALKGPYVMCPAPVLSGTVAKGKPRAVGTGTPILTI